MSIIVLQHTPTRSRNSCWWRKRVLSAVVDHRLLGLDTTCTTREFPTKQPLFDFGDSRFSVIRILLFFSIAEFRETPEITCEGKQAQVAPKQKKYSSWMVEFGAIALSPSLCSHSLFFHAAEPSWRMFFTRQKMLRWWLMMMGFRPLAPSDLRSRSKLHLFVHVANPLDEIRFAHCLLYCMHSLSLIHISEPTRPY